MLVEKALLGDVRRKKCHGTLPDNPHFLVGELCRD
ncbi:hypothetical protein EC919_1171 [Pseudomonas graminis]|nr:hypothetical protein EC919_1171 [Pseudomonas graminis]